MTHHFTGNDLSLLKSLAKSIGIPNLHLEIGGWDSDGDTLIIEHSEYINFYLDVEPYQTGHIVSFPGSFCEPPDDDYLGRMRCRTFAEAAQDCILHIVTEKLSAISEAASERTCDVSSDLLGSSARGLEGKDIGWYGFMRMDA